jgi:hypothetical protein
MILSLTSLVTIFNSSWIYKEPVKQYARLVKNFPRHSNSSNASSWTYIEPAKKYVSLVKNFPRDANPAYASSWTYIEPANKYVSLVKNFPRDACSLYTVFHQRFHMSCVFLERRRLTDDDCFDRMQNTLNSVLQGKTSVWVKLPTPCGFQASMYKKRANLEIGRWTFTSRSNSSVTQVKPDSILRCLRGKSVYYVGDSWMREIFATSVAWLTGEEMDDETRTFRQGDNREHPRSQNKAPYVKNCIQGFNISECGWLPMKIWNSDNVTLVFNMRTYYTLGDEFEYLLIRRLTPGNGNLQPRSAGFLPTWPTASVLVITHSTWGPTQGAGSPLDQLTNLYRRVVSGFAGTIIWVTTAGEDYGFLDWLRRNHARDKVILFDRVYDLQASTTIGIPSEHGYRGDVVYSHAKLLFELICAISDGSGSIGERSRRAHNGTTLRD